MRGLGCIGVAGAVALAASTAVAEPRPAGLRPDPQSVEAGLWNLSDKAEQHVRQSAELDADPALNGYVREVACKVASEYCGELRVYVLDRPFLNAQMAPNGYTEVWSGLLLRASDEAELAFVLGHEASHFAENHSLEREHAAKTRSDVALALSVGVAVVGAVAASGATTYQDQQNILTATGNLIDVVYLASLSSLFKFTREQEAEADELGFERAVKAGYAPNAPADMWRTVMAETAASDFEKVRKADARLGIFDTHPLSSVRVAALEADAKALPLERAGKTEERERYRTMIRPHLSAWLKDDLRRRDYGQTLYVLDQLAAMGEDLGVINFYRGETYRLRRRDGDFALARAAYETAIRYPDAPLAAWREIGDLAKRDKDAAGARAAYETYLSKAADADDAWLVRDSLNSLGQGV